MPLDDESCNFLAELILKFENSQNKNQALANYKACTVKKEIKEKYKRLIEANSSKFIKSHSYLRSVNTEEKLLEIIFIIVSMDSMVDIEAYKTYLHSEQNWLNTKHSDKIKIFPAYESNKFYEHSANSCLSSFLHNMVYFINLCCDIRCYYVDSTCQNIKEMIENGEIKVACIPYGMKETEDVNVEKEGDTEYELCTPKIDRDKALDERLVRNYKDAIKRGATLVLGAEMSGSKELDEKLYEVFKELPNAILWTPPYHCYEDEKPVSKSCLFHPQTRLKIPIYKVLPYNDKLENGVYKKEKIETNDCFIVLHVKNFGRILFLICSDLFHSEISNIIEQLRIDYVIISSCTPQTYTRFIELGYSSIKMNRRALVQCNHCINMKKSCEEIHNKADCSCQMTQSNIEKVYKNKYKPLNVIVKEMEGENDFNRIMEKFMENRHYPCSLEECMNYVILCLLLNQI